MPKRSRFGLHMVEGFLCTDMRTKGSCRFETYYKVESWCLRRCCWIPIQKAHKTLESARDAITTKQRIMECSESGIRTLEVHNDNQTIQQFYITKS
jgi:hypothetical protein